MPARGIARDELQEAHRGPVSHDPGVIVGVDLERRILHVVESKTGDEASIPLDETALAAFRSLPMKTGHVIEANFGQILEKQRFQALLRSLAKRAGIKRFGAHALRHTFATAILRATKNMYAVEKLARHRDPRMTRRYAALVPDELRADMEKLDGHLAEVLDQVPLGPASTRKRRPFVSRSVPPPRTGTDTGQS